MYFANNTARDSASYEPNRRSPSPNSFVDNNTDTYNSYRMPLHQPQRQNKDESADYDGDYINDRIEQVDNQPKPKPQDIEIQYINDLYEKLCGDGGRDSAHQTPNAREV